MRCSTIAIAKGGEDILRVRGGESRYTDPEESEIGNIISICWARGCIGREGNRRRRPGKGGGVASWPLDRVDVARVINH